MLESNPARDQHPIQGGVETLLVECMNATETGLTGLMGHLACMQALPYLMRIFLGAACTLRV